MDTVEKYELLPTLFRAAKGTENVLIEELQMCLRQIHDYGLAGTKSSLPGKSVHNVKKESFSGELRKHSTNFYIQFFKSMVIRLIMSNFNYISAAEPFPEMKKRRMAGIMYEHQKKVSHLTFHSGADLLPVGVIAVNSR